jgi:RNA polymerase subunit RPABC4/transcription elongation factor Spt4
MNKTLYLTEDDTFICPHCYEETSDPNMPDHDPCLWVHKVVTAKPNDVCRSCGKEFQEDE